MTQPHETNLTPRHVWRNVDYAKKYTGNYKPQSLASAAPSYKRIPPPRLENCPGRPSRRPARKTAACGNMKWRQSGDKVAAKVPAKNIPAKNACQAARERVSCLDSLEVEITVTDTARQHHALPTQDFEGKEGT
jgi:hypothetical protein